ncbi:E3 ubiquitin ligase BIG BROTHER-like protein [Tanacetum coccineum]
MSRSVDLHGRCLNTMVPDDIPENLMHFLPNDDGLSYEEVLLQQASMFQSFQERDKNKRVVMYDDDDIHEWGHLLVDEGDTSRGEDVVTQEAIDEALARSLQELGDGFDHLLIAEHSGSASGSTQSPIATPSRAQAASSTLMDDSIDTDGMQYEELLHLSEAIGTESRGISAERISQLPTSKYRSGFFSKNKKKEDK